MSASFRRVAIASGRHSRPDRTLPSRSPEIQLPWMCISKARRIAQPSPACEPIPIDQGELRSLLSSLSHELCRPLVSLRAGFDLLLQELRHGDQRPARASPDHGLALRRSAPTHPRLSRLCRARQRLSRPLVWHVLARRHRPGDRSPVPGSRPRARDWAWETFADEPESQVVTDASLCQQIFGNLVSNAIKYTPRGGHVRVECHAGLEALVRRRHRRRRGNSRRVARAGLRAVLPPLSRRALAGSRATASACRSAAS